MSCAAAIALIQQHASPTRAGAAAAALNNANPNNRPPRVDG